MAASRRDSAHRGYDTAYLLAPVAPTVIAALQGALQRVVADDVLGTGRRRLRRAGSPSWDAVQVQHLPADLADLELLQHIRAAGYRGAPFAVGVSGDRVALLVPHEFADGTESAALLGSLLRSAATGGGEAPPRPVRFPVLRAVRSTGVAPFRTFLRERGSLPATVADHTARVAPALASLAIAGEALTAVKRGRSTGGRATISTRLASIALSALVAAARDDRRAALVVPIDLRFAVRGRVTGNFVHGVELGTVDRSWAPGTLSAAIAERRATVVPAMVSGLVRPKGFATKRHTSWAQRLTVTLSMMQVPDLPEAVWASGDPADRRFVALSLSQNSDLLVVIATAKDAAYVTLLDATGWTDVERFPDAFRSEVDARRQPIA